MRIAVIGANGQLGTDIVAAARSAGCDVLPLTHADCDVADRASLEARLGGLRSGDAVINTAAFHRFEDCEERPDFALAVNALGAHLVATGARDRGAAVAFLSSDYVFDGVKRSPYVESDPARPINAYGVSKLAGEMLVCHANPEHYVVRVSGVFGVAGSSGKGGNFVETMLGKARRGERIEVVDDIVMAPTYAADASQLLVSLVTKRAPPGTYHLANAGSCSWYEFANAIYELAGIDVRAAPTSAGAQRESARRPAYSVLGSERLASIGLETRPWREALSDYLQAKGHLQSASARNA
jgi:dTDP-4-dehydrorhamnose reductase